MRINRELFTFLFTVLLIFVFCGRAQTEDYEAVSPYELSFNMTSFIGEIEVGEDEVRYFSGTFDQFLCEGKEIAVVTNKAEAGMIETEDYGMVRVSAGADGGLVVHLMPSQKKQLIEHLRQQMK